MRRIKVCHWLLPLCLLCVGCFPVASAPKLVRISELVTERQEQQPKEIMFPVVIDRFMDQRSHRNILGQYDIGGRGGFLGTVTVAADGDISSPFENIVKRSLKRKGIPAGQSPFVLKGIIQRAGVGASPDSRTLNAEVALELTLVDFNAGTRLWQKSYQGVSVGSEPQETLALAFQDLEMAIDKDESLLGLRKNFIALGGNLPEVVNYKVPEVNRTAIDIDNIPDFKAASLPDDIAIVIGIENYRGLPKSDYSKSDAGLVKNYLKALGFQERNIAFLADDKASLSDIKKTVETWLPNRIKKGSRIVVYYSGHGAPEPKTGDAYIVPFDGDPNYLEDTGYSLKKLYEKLGKMQATEVVVLLDSCFSGAGGRSVLAKGARPLVMMADASVISSNMAVLSAAQGTQISSSSPEKGHGIFTYYFLKALKDGKKNIAEIYEYIKPLVEDEARQLNVQQSPSINPDQEKIKGRFGLRK